MIDILSGYVVSIDNSPSTVLGGILSIICLLALLFMIWDIFIKP